MQEAKIPLESNNIFGYCRFACIKCGMYLTYKDAFTFVRIKMCMLTYNFGKGILRTCKWKLPLWCNCCQCSEGKNLLIPTCFLFSFWFQDTSFPMALKTTSLLYMSFHLEAAISLFCFLPFIPPFLTRKKKKSQPFSLRIWIRRVNSKREELLLMLILLLCSLLNPAWKDIFFPFPVVERTAWTLWRTPT